MVLIKNVPPQPRRASDRRPSSAPAVDKSSPSAALLGAEGNGAFATAGLVVLGLHHDSQVPSETPARWA